MELYSEQEIADKLGYNRATIARWRQDGKMSPIATKGNKMKVYFYDYDQVRHLSKAVDKSD